MSAFESLFTLRIVNSWTDIYLLYSETSYRSDPGTVYKFFLVEGTFILIREIVTKPTPPPPPSNKIYRSSLE